MTQPDLIVAREITPGVWRLKKAIFGAGEDNSPGEWKEKSFSGTESQAVAQCCRYWGCLPIDVCAYPMVNAGTKPRMAYDAGDEPISLDELHAGDTPSLSRIHVIDCGGNGEIKYLAYDPDNTDNRVVSYTSVEEAVGKLVMQSDFVVQMVVVRV